MTLREPTNAVASVALRPALGGRRREVRVLAAFRDALYLRAETELDHAEPTGGVVAVVGPAGIAHPNAFVVPRGASLPRWHVGQVGVLGEGQLTVGDVTLRPSRWWDPAVTLPPVDLEVLVARSVALAREARPVDGLTARLHASIDQVARAILLPDADAALIAGRRLLGLGPGLTPSGDDVLSGFFVAARSLRVGRAPSRTGPPAARDVADAALRLVAAALAAQAPGRTTAVSCALLRHAVRGHAATPVADVVRALAGHGSLERSLPRLLAVGSTSGRDLAIGIAAGARWAIAVRSPHADGTHGLAASTHGLAASTHGLAATTPDLAGSTPRPAGGTHRPADRAHGLADRSDHLADRSDRSLVTEVS